MKRAFTLYEMNYKVWEINFRNELSKGDHDYKKWILAKANKLNLSDNVYSEIFINNPMFAKVFFQTTLDSNFNLFPDDPDTTKIFFVLPAGTLLFNIAQPINKQFYNDNVQQFCEILKLMDNKEKYIIVEFNKKK